MARDSTDSIAQSIKNERALKRNSLSHSEGKKKRVAGSEKKKKNTKGKKQFTYPSQALLLTRANSFQRPRESLARGKIDSSPNEIVIRPLFRHRRRPSSSKRPNYRFDGQYRNESKRNDLIAREKEREKEKNICLWWDSIRFSFFSPFLSFDLSERPLLHDTHPRKSRRAKKKRKKERGSSSSPNFGSVPCYRT